MCIHMYTCMLRGQDHGKPPAIDNTFSQSAPFTLCLRRRLHVCISLTLHLSLSPTLFSSFSQIQPQSFLILCLLGNGLLNVVPVG